MVDGKYVPNFNGKKGSPFGIKPEDLNDQVWDFIMLNGPPPKNCKIPKVGLPKTVFQADTLKSLWLVLSDLIFD